jgi:hypothetical protein
LKASTESDFAAVSTAREQRYSVTDSQFSELFAPATEQWIGGDHESACPQLD